MTRGRAAILLFVVFVLGGVSGAVTTVTWLRSHGRFGRAGGGRFEETAVRRIARRLDLDPKQREILARVADETRGRMEQFREEAMLRVDEILDRAFDDLAPTLREDQKAKLLQMREETRRRLHEHHRRLGGPGGGWGHHDDHSRRPPAPGGDPAP